MSTFMRAYLRFGRTSAIVAREGHSDFGWCSHTSFESLRTPGTGGTQAENKPTHLSWATGSSRAIPKTGTLEA